MLSPGAKHNIPKELETLIREVVKWNQRCFSSKTHYSSNLSPAACLFLPDKVPLSSTPPPGTEPKTEGGFSLTAEGNSAHVDTKNVDSGHVNTFNVDTIVK
ncbi:hypothetical protein DSO57_1036693 [Entomophthora muscae]|uniref:Uncharacterized protein n=1 Tax=Entomophthora muscae TaxID=34485 RepID=A0ACC2TA75_9FUNG|nr:hypothetical protein DSO57_1036693 [Entomophthora muscae]